MFFIKINDTELPTPCYYSVTSKDITGTDSGRYDETGIVHRNRVRSCVKSCDIKWRLPGSSLEPLNAALSGELLEGTLLDPATGDVRIANAGHVPPLLVGEAVRTAEVNPGVLLGLFEDAGIGEEALALRQGESLFLCTDGVTEAVSADGRFFGEESLVASLAEHAPLASAEDVVSAVVADVDVFASGREQFDDLTVVAIRRLAAGDAALPVESASTESADRSGRAALPVDIASFSTVRGEILAQAPDAESGRRACLACEELFANIVSYSDASGIWYKVAPEGEGLRVELEDDGAPFDPTQAEAVEKAFEDLDTGGMGLNLIRSLADGMTYARAGNRNITALSFSPSEEPSP